jgi:ParB-like chromosome segregation protein Spo0J
MTLPKGKVETVRVDTLRPHPRNYRSHPDDQRAHLVESLKTYGFYRSIVVANDGTVLAGHGILEAAQSIGLDEVPIVRYDFGPDDPLALRIIVADNEIGRLAEIDDRAMTEMLRDLVAAEQELLGTGFSHEQLALLVMTTRSQGEVRDKNAAAEWIGLPSYENVDEPVKLVVSFRSEEDRQAFVEQNQLTIMKTLSRSWSTWWPTKEEDEYTAVKVEG